MLKASGICKSFGPTRALIDVDFDLAPGEIVALAGENGSGKSTFASILAGATTADAGEIHLDGVEVSFNRPREALSHGVALVSQEPTLAPNLTIAENVALASLARPHSIFHKKRLAREVAPLLGGLGVYADPLLPLEHMPPAQWALVAIAKALATSPRVLILDEATSWLGEGDVALLFQRLCDLSRDGVAIVLITHRLKEICALASSAVVLRDGCRVAKLADSEITESRIAATMVGRELTEFFHKPEIELGEPALSVRDLRVADAPGPVSFDVMAGEVVGIAGLVGSGRSELLETIAGVRRPVDGEVLVAGSRVRSGSPKAALDAGIAFVPEDRHRQGLVLGASIQRNVAMGAWGYGPVDARRERDWAEAAIADLRVRAMGPETPIMALSGGNQQKVVLARCLRRQPRVLLVDEPTRGIDVGAKEEIFRLIGLMLERGLAVVMVSSELIEVLGIADRILVMKEGTMAGELSRSDATEERIVQLAAGEKEMV